VAGPAAGLAMVGPTRIERAGVPDRNRLGARGNRLMSTMSKVFVVLNLVLALFLVGSVASILSNGEDWRKKCTTAEDKAKADLSAATEKYSKLDGVRQNLDNSVRSLENQKSDLDSQLQTQKATADQFRNDNNQLRNSVDAINTSLKAVQGELGDTQTRNKELLASNETLKKETADAKKAQMDAEDDRARIEGDLKRATDDVAEKERQLSIVTKERDNKAAMLDALVKAGVDVPKIIGNNVPLIEGKISDVGPNFVVLSVGEKDSVQIGYTFDVYRGGDYIGRVIVDMVRPETSTARVTMKNPKGLEFQRMDNATTRL
jgi:septal ring factor EnvC (AmiA/AmiB activator)